MTYLNILITSYLETRFAYAPKMSGYAVAWDDIQRKLSSLLGSIGEVATGGGVIILALLGLVLAIMVIFGLIMMLRR